MRCRAKERVIRSGARARDGRGRAQGEARIADSHLRGSEMDNATATEWCAIVAGARQGTIGHDLTVKKGGVGPERRAFVIGITSEAGGASTYGLCDRAAGKRLSGRGDSKTQ
jgi:hypothetical protein